MSEPIEIKSKLKIHDVLLLAFLLGVGYSLGAAFATWVLTLF